MPSEYTDRTSVSNLCPQLNCDEEQILKLYRLLDEKSPFKAPLGELSIALVSKDEITRLHDDFMNDATPTDVITFPGDPDFGEAGEICVCPEVAHEYAKKNDLNFSNELTLYLAHGYLHLAGLDDIQDADRQEMRKAEAIVMEIVTQAEAVPTFEFHPQ